MLWLCRVTDEPSVRSQLFTAAPVWPKKNHLGFSGLTPEIYNTADNNVMGYHVLIFLGP